MEMSMKLTTVATCLVLSIIAIAARAEGPSTKPADATLLDGKIHYSPPDKWMGANSDVGQEMGAAYHSADDKSAMMIIVAPEKTVITAQSAASIAKNLRATRQKTGQKIVMDPKIEKDPRFLVRIQEKYKTDDGATHDELHLYRKIGTRAVQVTVSSISDDEAQLKAFHKAAEDTLLSAKAAEKR
jgi:hypothetical protein